MEKDPIPQATSPLATWLSYLEHLHSKTIDLGLARVSEQDKSSVPTGATGSLDRVAARALACAGPRLTLAAG
ncbi:hypothetical protein LAN16_21305, partial [Mycobacterium tuberculosis]|nr:hypothetical protein [Mycobacterium tuberculosis]